MSDRAELVRLNIARCYAHDALKRAERSASGNPHLMPGILAAAADALSDAAEIVRARIARLEDVSPSVASRHLPPQGGKEVAERVAE